jgi:hypothetical protein
MANDALTSLANEWKNKMFIMQLERKQKAEVS